MLFSKKYYSQRFFPVLQKQKALAKRLKGGGNSITGNSEAKFNAVFVPVE